MQRKYPKQFRFDIPEELEPTFIKLAKIADREGRSQADIARELLCDYARLHEPGNPQQRIDIIAERGQAYRAPLVCENPSCKAEVKELQEVLVLSGAKRKYCEKCVEQKSKPPYKTITKILRVVHR